MPIGVQRRPSAHAPDALLACAIILRRKMIDRGGQLYTMRQMNHSAGTALTTDRVRPDMP